jgi:hypothetical protein
MTLLSKSLLIILVVLDLIVLLGQMWPEGAPPFARTVNILFLIFNLVFLVFGFRKRKV